MMQSPRAARFKHVVFAQPRRRRRIVDFTPASSRASRLPQAEPLGGEDAFVHWLFARAGLDATRYRRETLRRRLPACLRFLRVASCAAARQLLHQHPAHIVGAIGAMLIGVTSFFRDARVFDHLTYTVLRDLGRGARSPRIWSAGCSDGEELYSIAILLAELQLLPQTYLLGTDCRTTAIARARAGCYTTPALADVPAEWLARYFTRQRDGWQVDDALRSRVQWRSGDVTALNEPGGWDVILCRNLAMYLQPHVAARLWKTLESSLLPGGFLIVGKAERPMTASRLQPVAPCIYRRNGA
jgi:chemotaxis methyl-accepting protein methylase